MPTKSSIIKLASLLVVICFTTSYYANATTITFDDISIKSYGDIPENYHDFQWKNFGYIYYSEVDIDAPINGYHNGVTSYPYVAYGLSDASIVAEINFSFTSAYFTSAFIDGMKINITGYKNNIEKFNIERTLSIYSSTLINADFTDVDKLYFHTDGLGEGQFAMDNFTYTTLAAPEPATLVLVGISLIGFIGVNIFRSRMQ